MNFRPMNRFHKVKPGHLQNSRRIMNEFYKNGEWDYTRIKLRAQRSRGGWLWNVSNASSFLQRTTIHRHKYCGRILVSVGHPPACRNRQPIENSQVTRLHLQTNTWQTQNPYGEQGTEPHAHSSMLYGQLRNPPTILLIAEKFFFPYENIQNVILSSRTQNMLDCF